jgi:hypothetical protein
MIDDHRTLPHYPRKSLVLAVRKQLNRYGIRPTGSLPTTLNQIWRDAWEWAAACRYVGCDRPNSRRLNWNKWPTAREIAAQYVYLLLANMQSDFALSLPYAARSGRVIPAAIAARYEIPTPSTVPLLEKDHATPTQGQMD